MTDIQSKRLQEEAVDYLLGQVPKVWLVNMIIASLFIAGLWGTVDIRILLGWWFAFFLSWSYRYFLHEVYRRTSLDSYPVEFWVATLTRTALYQGFLWGFAAYFFFVSNAVAAQALVFLLVLGFIVGSLSLNAHLVRSFFAFMVPAVTLLAIRLLQEGTQEHTILAIIVVLFAMLLSRLAVETSRSFSNNIRLHFENSALVAELREQKQEAEVANRAKTRFLAAASHDLRQPIQSLVLLGEALEREVYSTKGQELLGYIKDSIDSLNQLLSSLLDISKLDARVVEPKLSAIEVDSLLSSIVREFQPLADEKGLSVTLHSRAMVVKSDPALLGNILRNLVANAIRYTNEGRVLLGCRKRGDTVLLEVWDSGIGIPFEEQGRVFSEFHQLHNPERDRNKGLGLGLAICNRLALLLNHPLELCSLPGRGSRFRILVPLADEVVVAESLNQRGQTPDWDIQGRHILIVDDEVAVRQSMEALLQRWGCLVSQAANKSDALLELEEHGRFDLAIIDYRLRDGENGLDVIKALKKVSGDALPALLVTGDTAPERLQEANRSGYPLLHKPVNAAQLRTVLNRLLRSS